MHPAPGFWQTLWRVYKKDTVLEWRSPVGLFSVLLFAMILAAVYNYAMAESTFRQVRNLHGIMLATLFFASTIVSGRNIHFEKEGGALRNMLMSPADPAGYFLGKVAALWQLQIAFCVVFVPLYHLMLTGRPPGWREFQLPLLFLGMAALSLAALGIMLSYVAAGNRLRELVLPLLQLPTSLPVFMLAADGLAVSSAAASGGEAFAWNHFLILIAPAAILCAIGCLLYHSMAADE